MIERTGKTAVFIGRDGRWLYYMAKLLGDQENDKPNDKIKFIDIGRNYTYHGDYARDTSLGTGQRGKEYAGYFKKMSVKINESFLVDVGFQGTITHDIREATDTKDDDDILLVKSDVNLNPGIKGFYEWKSSPDWDEHMKMGHFIETLPQIVSPVDELPPVRGGRLPKYKNTHDNLEKFLAQMTYRYLKNSAEAFAKNRKSKETTA